jgi:thiol-disulfide isomerase/thioredoxin
MRSFFCFLACCLLFAGAPTGAKAEPVRAVPVCPLKSLADGKPLDLRQFRGKVVYVDFWASWCSTCAQSFPFLSRLSDDLEGRGLVVVGINVDERPQDAVAFLGKHPATFVLASSPDMECPKAFAVPGMPASFLIDRQGRLRSSHLGFRRSDADKLRQQVTQLLDEKTADTQEAMR